MIAWLPTERALVVYVQEPPEVSEQVPRKAPPSERLTVPVGIPSDAETATVRVTGAP